jgi:hypothetical protein
MGRVFLSPSKASSGTTGAKPVRSLVDDAVRSPSKPLDLETRKFMEPRFHYDFSNVRIHADDSAGRASRALNASAFTVGRHVIFDSGHYDPHTRAGRRLLAHELTHVAQQGDHATSVDGAQVVADAQDPAEQEAVAAADRVAVGQPVDVRRNAGKSRWERMPSTCSSKAIPAWSCGRMSRSTSVRISRRNHNRRKAWAANPTSITTSTSPRGRSFPCRTSILGCPQA